MRLLIAIALLFSVLSTACSPTQHDQSRYSTVTVAFGAPLDSAGPWRSDQLVELRAELAALNALGPTFVEASEGSAQIVVRPFDSGPGCALGAARFTPGTTFVEIDPSSPCTNGFTELRAAMGHEVFHAVTGSRTHVCFTAGELPDCSPVGYGPAMMNPQISYGDPIDPNGGPLGVATDVPTDLDLAEWRRTHP